MARKTLLIIGATVVLFACDRAQDREPYGSAPSATPTTPAATNTSTTAQNTPTTPPATQSSAPPAPAIVMFTDAQTFAVLDAANTAELDQSNEAVRRTKRDKVKTFAQHMITAHTKAQKDIADVAKKYAITKEPSDTSRKLQDDAKNELGTLKGANAADFDRQYVEAMIDQHQALLDMIEQKLLPSAQNPDVKSMLEKLRDDVRDHLQMARDTRASLSKA